MPNTIEGVFAFALANPTHDGGTWHNWCESFDHRAGGFDQSFSTATLAGSASGWLDPDYRTATRGSIHYWGNGAGHVAFELGGDVLLMASDAVTHLLTWQHIALGTVSHADYARAKPAMRYRGHTKRHGTQTLAPSTISSGVGTTTAAVPNKGVHTVFTINRHGWVALVLPAADGLLYAQVLGGKDAVVGIPSITKGDDLAWASFRERFVNKDIVPA